jgi:hypothetical protein
VTPDNFLVYSLNLYAKAFRSLERSWTGDKAINQDTLRSLGTTACAGLVIVSPCYAMRIYGNIPLDSIGIVSRTTHRLL